MSYFYPIKQRIQHSCYYVFDLAPHLLIYYPVYNPILENSDAYFFNAYLISSYFRIS